MEKIKITNFFGANIIAVPVKYLVPALAPEQGT